MHSPGAFIEFERAEIEQSISDRFEKQVERFPDSLAIKTRNHRFTYRELNQEANRIARALFAMHGRTEEPVVLLLEQGAPLLAALLGVLKSGKAYVPIDPAYPEARNRYILKDSQSSLILTNKRNLDLAHTLAVDKQTVLNLEDMPEDVPEINLKLPISPDHLAYIIYTSGSTGKPKGVMQNHRNVLHNCMRRTNAQRLAASDRLTLLYSGSVMGSVYGIFGALLNGASIFPRDLREEGLSNFDQWLLAEEITVYHSVASVFRHFVAGLKDGPGFPEIRLVIFGGERVLTSDIHLVRKHISPNCALFTGLGSTETGTVRQMVVTPETVIPGKVVPLGYSVDEMEVLLLDESGCAVALNQIGEIAVRSRYLSPGYWQKPELTRQVFLQDGESAEERVYLTGDLGCMDSDRLLVHCGRKDFQVKIRGFRIDISEIETSLLEHPAVQEVVVVARDNPRGEQSLVAYFVPKPSIAREARELRIFLDRRLPAHMVPERFVALDALPRTPNGKVERSALPAPDTLERAGSTESCVSARDETEEMLVAIWEDKFKVHPIGIRDDFFSLGGHSLLAAQIFRKIEEQFGSKLPLSTLLQTPTIEGIARVLQEQDLNSSLSTLVPIQPHGTKPAFYLIHGIGGNILNFFDLANRLGPDQPVYGLQSQGLDGKKPVLARVEDMAAVYVEEIRRFQPVGPYYIGGMSFGGRVAYEIARQLHAQGQLVALLALLDSYPRGYARLLRRREKTLARVRFILGKGKSHWEALSAVPTGQRWDYLATKLHTLQRRIKSKLWQNAYHLQSANARLGNKIL
ncbi:MAG: amino acid adenylation domain-containing protein [Verrucomicrobiota bacterium]